VGVGRAVAVVVALLPLHLIMVVRRGQRVKKKRQVKGRKEKKAGSESLEFRVADEDVIAVLMGIHKNKTPRSGPVQEVKPREQPPPRLEKIL
jgi:hypothetical protein